MEKGPSKDLLDPLVLFREFWSFFVQTLRSDMIIHKNATDFIVTTSFDDMQLEHAAHFVEAMKTTIIDPWMMAYRNATPVPPAFDVLKDDYAPDFDLKDVTPTAEPDHSYACYGCNKIVNGTPGALCFRCRGLDT